MSVRRITNGGRKVIGKFPSLKNGKPVWYESLLERDFMYLLEHDTGVISYKEQPFRILYVLDGKIHKYVPDLLIQRKEKRQIVEVKPERKTSAEEFMRKTRLIGQICTKEGYEYVVATEREIRMEPRLSNIKLLNRYSSTKLSYQNQIGAYAFFSKKPEAPLRELQAFFKSKNAGIQTIFALIHRGMLVIDLNKPIGSDIAVRLSEADYIKEKSA